MQLKFKQLHPDAQLPAYAHDGDSGMDLRAIEDTVLLPGVPTLVRTGIAVELPEPEPWEWLYGGYSTVLFEAQVRPRSGLALKHGITVVNAPGTVDSNYRGEIGVILRWDGHAPNANEGYGGVYRIRKGDRIAQLVIAPVIRCTPEWGEVGETERGAGGFGSTGK